MSFAWKFGFWFTLWASIVFVGIYAPNLTVYGWIKAAFLIVGIVLMAYGLLLNAVAGRTLKKYGHFEIGKGIKKPEKLVTEGIYSCMRHPAQFGSIFFGIGISFITMNIFAVLYAGWVSFISLYFILSIEERETIKNFGEDYCRFLVKRKPFTLSPRCLIRGIKVLRDNGNLET